MENSLAIIDSQGRVVTFVRSDVPDGWQPPNGCTAIPYNELPSDWIHAPDDSPVPKQISARQIRLWLVQHNISLSAVETAINNISDPIIRDSVRVEWEYAPYIERSHPWLIPLAQAIGLSESEIDTAFREAYIL